MAKTQTVPGKPNAAAEKPAVKPSIKPGRANFSSGPCAKPPGWSLDDLGGAALGRYHRSRQARRKILEALERARMTLELPDSHRLAILPGSDTGAFEALLWSLLGPRGVDVLAWESFGATWAGDARDQLPLEDVRVFEAEYGALPDLSAVDWARDVVFAWNGTTSGVRVPDADWIASDREGLSICDATSAVFAQCLDWSKLDAATFSWQKSLGGEAGFGMAVLGPRALERLRAHRPPWPMPKLFRLGAGGGVDQTLFEGGTINTISLLLVEDFLACLKWAAGIGGLEELIRRADANSKALYRWAEASDWCAPLCAALANRSNTSVCLRLRTDPSSAADRVKVMADLLEREGAAFDILHYRAAPPGLRIWCGPTVELEDVRALAPWLDWAFAATAP